VSDKLHVSPTLPTAESSYAVSRRPNGWQSVGTLHIRTLKTSILSISILRCFVLRLHDAKNVCFCGSSALNCINSACMSGSFKLYLTSMPGHSGLHFSLLAECIIILLNHSWFVRSPLIKCKFFNSFVVVVLSFTDKETIYIYICFFFHGAITSYWALASSSSTRIFVVSKSHTMTHRSR